MHLYAHWLPQISWNFGSGHSVGILAAGVHRWKLKHQRNEDVPACAIHKGTEVDCCPEVWRRVLWCLEMAVLICVTFPHRVHIDCLKILEILVQDVQEKYWPLESIDEHWSASRMKASLRARSREVPMLAVWRWLYSFVPHFSIADDRKITVCSVVPLLPRFLSDNDWISLYELWCCGAVCCTVRGVWFFFRSALSC